MIFLAASAAKCEIMRYIIARGLPAQTRNAKCLIVTESNVRLSYNGWKRLKKGAPPQNGLTKFQAEKWRRLETILQIVSLQKIQCNKYCNTLPYGTQIRSTTPKLFFHESGPEQRSRADNRCIRLQMSLRIFFVSTICWKSVNSVQDAIFVCVLPIKINFDHFLFYHKLAPDASSGRNKTSILHNIARRSWWDRFCAIVENI